MAKESIKNDRKDNKLRWELLPWEDIEDIVKVYHAGSEKYGENTWQNLPDGMRRYFAAAMRHIMLHMKGEVFDPETGCRHLAQATFNLIAMLHISKNEEKKEDSDTCVLNHNTPCESCKYYYIYDKIGNCVNSEK